MSRIVLTFLLMIGACAPDENSNRPLFQEADMPSVSDPTPDVVLMAGGSGTFTSNIPELEVGTMVPGELATFVVSGLENGQSVAIFAGTPTERPCGTRPREAYQPFIGRQCLASAGATLIGGGAVGWNGELEIRLPVPPNVALGLEVEFQAVVVAIGHNPRSEVHTRFTTDTWMDCESKETFWGGGIRYGTNDIYFGNWSCATRGNGPFLEGKTLNWRNISQESLEMPELRLDLYADGNRIGGPESLPDGGRIEFDVDHPFFEGQEVFLEVFGDLGTPTGRAFGGPLRLELVEIITKDQYGDEDAPWIGRGEIGNFYEVLPTP